MQLLLNKTIAKILDKINAIFLILCTSNEVKSNKNEKVLNMQFMSLTIALPKIPNQPKNILENFIQ